MDRAINFYELLLDQKVSERYSVLAFSISNIIDFVCLIPPKVIERHIWGNNCLPSFQVNKMELLLKRIDELSVPIGFLLTKVWSYSLKIAKGMYCKQMNCFFGLFLDNNIFF
ncbi:hypothetical protein ATX04_05880 [Oenococcus oeni]|uniref:Uncharacterized protein n=7 Tax=Oenococcus oeni TaxID=1247 RepID=Q04EV2_OENOB|nr:hypothetical protein OEOE_1122 [Oenococcus oeni PSU-1]OIL28686.1 hypothetical protein ATX04_05880 [Oenococcus oeni]